MLAACATVRRSDAELRLVPALRRATRERSAPLPSIAVADALLDERVASGQSERGHDAHRGQEDGSLALLVRMAGVEPTTSSSAIASFFQSLNVNANLFVADAFGSFLTGAGGYLLGGFGAPGFLRRIAYETFVSLRLNPIFAPLGIALLPWVLIYVAETWQPF